MALPSFNYMNGTVGGDFESEEHADGGWKIRLKGSGTLTFADNQRVDAFLVGGGGGGGTSAGATHSTGSGGGGGFVRTLRGVALVSGVGYPIQIGSGGAPGADGGETRAFAASAAGGRSGTLGGANAAGGAGGSGGGGAEGYNKTSGGTGGAGGTDGGDGAKGQSGGEGGKGSAHYGVPHDKCAPNTREFGEAGGALYAGGGGGGGGYSDAGEDPVHHAGGAGGAGGGGKGGGGNQKGGVAEAGTPNTGGGGGGCGRQAGTGSTTNIGAAGGSGIVILRPAQEAPLPIRFNRTTTLTKIQVGDYTALAVEYQNKRITPCTVLTLTAGTALEGESVTVTGTDALSGQTDTQTGAFSLGQAVFRLRHRTTYEIQCAGQTEIYCNLEYGEATQAFPMQLTGLIPTMTSGTSPEGEVTISGGYQNGRQAWHAFDGLDTTSWTSGVNESAPWIQYEFAEAIPAIRMLDIRCAYEGYAGNVNPNGTTITASVSQDGANFMDFAEIRLTQQQLGEHVRIPITSLLPFGTVFKIIRLTINDYITSNSGGQYAMLAYFQCYKET